MLPNYLIIGSARCGTSYIAKNLGSHPEVFMPLEKELHFFDRNYSNGIDYYKSLFPDSNSNKYKAVGEATPAYLYFPEIPGRIKEHLPDAKLIISLRNPVDAAYSMYWNAYAADERTRKMTFEEKLQQEPRLIEGGKYFEQMQRYMGLFPKENIHIIIFEELMANANAEFAKLYKFLGVDETFVSPYLRHEINSSGMKVGKSMLLYYLYKGFLNYLKIPEISRWLEKLNTNMHSSMNKTTRKLLENEFSDSNKSLQTLIQRDLAQWWKRE